MTINGIVASNYLGLLTGY